MDRLKQVENAFTYHRPSPEAIQTMTRLRELAAELARRIAIYVPPGREQATALTKVEESIMWANAGIVRHPVDEDEGPRDAVGGAAVVR